MLWCVFLIVLVVAVSSDETFKNVTVLGGSKPVHIKSAGSLIPHLSEKNILNVSFASGDVVPILYTNAITDLSHLESLDLSHHKVGKIQKGAFRNLPKLQNLLLNDNELIEIKNDVFNNLKSLTCLSLSRNQIENIQERAFDNLQNLMFLFLATNKLTTFDSDWFNEKPSLFQVDLTENLIEEIPDGAFANYQNAIFLGGNKIQHISHNIFGEGRRLQQLSLHDNEIENWDEDLFENVTVASFDIFNNKIRCLSGNFSKLFAAAFTGIGDNPWNCSCLEAITEWASNEPLQVSIDWGSSPETCKITDLSTRQPHRQVFSTEWEQFFEIFFWRTINY